MQEPFIAAFAQYLEAFQEATCDNLLGRKPAPEQLKAAGRRLVESAGPELEGLSRELATRMEKIEWERGSNLYDEVGLNDVADALREFEPYFEKDGLTFYVDEYPQTDAPQIETYLGKCVEVEAGNVRSTVILKKLVDTTTNRLTKKMGEDKPFTAFTGLNGETHHDFEAMAEAARDAFEEAKTKNPEAMNDWTDKEKFAIGYALISLTGSIPHEFHHQNIVKYEEKETLVKVIGAGPNHPESMTCIEDNRDLQEAGAHLYSLANASKFGPVQTMMALEAIYGLESSFNEDYVKAGKFARFYLAMTDYSEKDRQALRFGDEDSVMEASARISKYAKQALKFFESGKGLASHEEVERELKPDFKAHYEAVKKAVLAYHRTG